MNMTTIYDYMTIRLIRSDSIPLGCHLGSWGYLPWQAERNMLPSSLYTPQKAFCRYVSLWDTWFGRKLQRNQGEYHLTLTDSVSKHLVTL